MAERKRLGLDDVKSLAPNQETWDPSLPSFGARRQRSESVSYVLLYRTADNVSRRFTIGKHGAPWTPSTAREEARRLMGMVADGKDPAAEKQSKRHADTMADLCRQYLADAEAGRLLVRGGKPKKPLTLASDKGRIEGHIIPLLGRLPVTAVTKRDVEKFMHAVAAGDTAKSCKTKPRGVSNLRGGRGVATRSVGLLGGILSYAVDRGLRADNPAHRVRKFSENKRTRRLSDDEYATLGNGLRHADCKIWQAAVNCFRFLALSGWRSGEAVALRWSDVDLSRRTVVLPDSKSGRSVRALSSAACELLRNMPRLGDNALVFPATRGDGLMVGFKKFARRIIADAGLPPDITPHILRHSFASLAADLGFSEPTIGALLGHRGHSVTSRYMHGSDSVMLTAADAVENELAWRMGEPRVRSADAAQFNRGESR